MSATTSTPTQSFAGLLTGSLSIAPAAIGAAVATEAALSAQSSIFQKALAILEELCSFGPVVVSAVDPAFAPLATAAGEAVNHVAQALTNHVAANPPAASTN